MKKDTPSYMFSCEFYEILQDSIFIEYIQRTATVIYLS